MLCYEPITYCGSYLGHVALRGRATTVTMSSSKCAVTYKECFKYLFDGERYAKGTSESRKRSIRRFTTGRVTVENGILYYCENGQEKMKRQWIETRETQTQILQSIHHTASVSTIRL